MERSAGQRRFDALRAIFERAVSAPPGSRAPEPVVNLVIDYQLWEAWLARMFGEDPDAPLPDPADVDVRRCETSDGIHVNPPAAVMAALVGHVRRVVMNRAGVVIHLGRKHRLSPAPPARRRCCNGARRGNFSNWCCIDWSRACIMA